MGLIKTAILTSGGIYAVNKLAKANQAQPNYPPQNYNYPPQGYWGPPPQGQQRGYAPEGYYNNNQGQQQWGPSPSSQQYDQRAYNDTRYSPAEGYDSRGPSNNPPAYYQQPQSYNNMAPQGQAYDSIEKKESSSSGSRRN